MRARVSSGLPSQTLAGFDPPPAHCGYAMPAEWERHDATWIAWPHNREDWPGKFEPIPWIYAEIVRLIAPGERVHIFVEPSERGRLVADVKKILARNDVNFSHVTFHGQGTDRVWTRDSGPIFVRRESRIKKQGAGNKNQESRSKNQEDGSSLAVVDFKFNGWAKYDNSKRDDQLPGVVADYLKVPRFVAFGENNKNEMQRFVLEGGSIDVNGAGCVMTTEECLLSKVQQRNPGFSRERVEGTLRNYLGVEQVLWLDRGIAGDDTHGHIDDTARFVDARTIVACVEPDRKDANHGPMKENLRRLKGFRDVRGKAFEVVELPLPSPVYFAGQRLPASYANFYIANVGVLVPVFNDPNDGVALRILEACFRKHSAGRRAVIPVYCRDLVWGLGTLHCMTQQQPAVE